MKVHFIYNNANRDRLRTGLLVYLVEITLLARLGFMDVNVPLLKHQLGKALGRCRPLDIDDIVIVDDIGVFPKVEVEGFIAAAPKVVIHTYSSIMSRAFAALYPDNIVTHELPKTGTEPNITVAYLAKELAWLKNASCKHLDTPLKFAKAFEVLGSELLDANKLFNSSDVSKVCLPFIDAVTLKKEKEKAHRIAAVAVDATIVYENGNEKVSIFDVPLSVLRNHEQLIKANSRLNFVDCRSPVGRAANIKVAVGWRTALIERRSTLMRRQNTDDAIHKQIADLTERIAAVAYLEYQLEFGNN